MRDLAWADPDVTMPLVHTLTILICLAALFSYINHRVLKLPITIGLVAIPLVLAARWVSVLIQVKGFNLVREFSKRTVTILIWGGVRGGISVALALSLPAGSERDAIVTMTYTVVMFSILVQGLTIGKVLGRSGEVIA
jgi:CPA1 family monovalent cation:H+ antiporter